MEIVPYYLQYKLLNSTICPLFSVFCSNFASGVSFPLYLEIFYIIYNDPAGFKPVTSDPEVWRAINELMDKFEHSGISWSGLKLKSKIDISDGLCSP